MPWPIGCIERIKSMVISSCEITIHAPTANLCPVQRHRLLAILQERYSLWRVQTGQLFANCVLCITLRRNGRSRTVVTLLNLVSMTAEVSTVSITPPKTRMLRAAIDPDPSCPTSDRAVAQAELA